MIAGLAGGLGGAVMVPAVVTGVVVLGVLVLVARTARRDRRNSAGFWEQFQALYAEHGQDAQDELVHGAARVRAVQGRRQEAITATPGPSWAAGSARPAVVSVLGVQDLDLPSSRPSARPAVTAVPAGPAGPGPVRAAAGPVGADRPGAGARVRAGGKWGHVRAVSTPALGVIRFHLRMDDGTSAHVDVPDSDTLGTPADQFAAARAAQVQGARRVVPAPPVARLVPAPAPRPARATPAAAPVRRASAVSVGGFTLPVTSGMPSGRGGRS